MKVVATLRLLLTVSLLLPFILLVGAPELAGELPAARLAGIPITAWMTVIAFAVFIALVWRFARTADKAGGGVE